MNTTPKMIFFDIDGTLVDGDMAPSPATVDTLLALKDRGHLLSIATGRSLHEITDNLRALPFDALICSNGAYAAFSGKPLLNIGLDRNTTLNVGRYLERYGAHLIVGSNTTSYVRQSAVDFWVNELLPALGIHDDSQDFIGSLTIIDDLAEVELPNKLLYFNFRGDADDFKGKFGDLVTIFPNSITRQDTMDTGEVTPQGVSKGSAVKQVLQAAGIDVADSFAFGDGYNDFELLRAAGTGVAMGNAVPALKEAADYVTTSVDADGISAAIKHFNLI